jgi:SAM-dependent methyltransferase
VERSRSRSVLDAGCGTGRLLAALTGKGRRLGLFGIDLSPTMLGRARERLRSHDGPMLLEQGDLLGLHTSPAGDEPVDCMVLMHVLGHVPEDVGEAIAERAERFVKPRGYVVVVDHAWHRPRAALSRMVLLSSRRFRGGAITVRVYRTPGAEPAQRQWAT